MSLRTDILALFAGQSAVLTIPRPFITLCGGDHLTALLFSQILYWAERSKDPDGWFAKTYADWESELSLTKRQVMRSVEVLRDLGVETKVMRSSFHGARAVLHYRVDRRQLERNLESHFSELRNVTSRSDETSLQGVSKRHTQYTETIAEIIPESPAAAAPARTNPDSSSVSKQPGQGPGRSTESETRLAPALPAIPAIEPVPPQPNAFALWFAVSGALTPYDGEQIRDAIQEFGESFVEAAIKEAGRNSARKWSYVDTVLRNCRAQNRFPGEPKPSTRPPAAQQAAKRAATEDPDNWAGKASGLGRPIERKLSREDLAAIRPMPPGWKPGDKIEMPKPADTETKP